MKSPRSTQAQKAFQELIQAAWKEQQFALARCFAFVGVGGKEATDFSKERAKALFGGKYSTIQFLEQWHQLPSSWSAAKEEMFEKELKENLK